MKNLIQKQKKSLFQILNYSKKQESFQKANIKQTPRFYNMGDFIDPYIPKKPTLPLYQLKGIKERYKM
jgi:hypothetical protein